MRWLGRQGKAWEAWGGKVWQGRHREVRERQGIAEEALGWQRRGRETGDSAGGPGVAREGKGGSGMAGEASGGRGRQGKAGGIKGGAGVAVTWVGCVPGTGSAGEGFIIQFLLFLNENLTCRRTKIASSELFF